MVALEGASNTVLILENADIDGLHKENFLVQ